MLPSFTQKYIRCYKQRSACVTSKSYVRIPWSRNMPCTVRSSCTTWRRLYRFIFRKKKEEFTKFIWIAGSDILPPFPFPGSCKTLDKDTFFKIEDFVYQVCPPNSDIKWVSNLRLFLFKNQSKSDRLRITKYSIGQSTLPVYLVSVNNITEEPLILSIGNCDWKWVEG